MIEISNSVGFEGANVREDILKIQRALNSIPSECGGPQRPLAVDGLCGPSLRAAIGRLQLHYFTWSDLRINRRGKTIRIINAFLSGQKPLIERQNFNTGQIQQLTRTSSSTNSQQILGSITHVRGTCFLNGELLETGNNYPFTRGARIGTGDDGALQIIWHGYNTIPQFVPSASLIVALGRDTATLNAGNSSATSLERGTLGASLASLAGL